MNNSSVSRSNHSTRVLVSICFVILLCVVIALWFSKVNAANIVRRTVSMYLDESYSLSTGAITQCNITLLNDEQECIAYMIGDFQYGNCIAWISPDYENAFVAQEGPQPDN